MRKTRENVNELERIVIERRETVAIIEADPYGEMPMLEAAFLRAGDYLANHAEPQPGQLIGVEWSYRGLEFGAHIRNPEPPEPESLPVE